MPLVFIRAEGDAIDLAGKVALCFPCAERDLHRVIVGLIAVDQHHRPLAIRTLHSVSGDQNVSRGIIDVTRGFELLVWRVDGLHPFFRDQLRGNILRRITHHFVVLIDQQKVSKT